ncbi:ankyrin repeat protein [Ilyonectria robusta]
MEQHHRYNDVDAVPFKSIKLIGGGAVGVVDEVLGLAGPFRNRVYARKTIVLVEDPAGREAELLEIEKEVEILREASHHHIVKLVTTYLFDDNYAIVMDPRADSHLERSLQQNTPEAAEKISTWFGCLLSGVAYAHQRGIRHRDIKPHNILVKDGTILLSDFGISMMGLGITVPTTILGRPRGRTPEYCAPEVEQGHTRGRSADIFSLGAVFLEMLSVCSYSGEGREKLGEFRSILKVDGRQSYALSIQKVGDWMDSLKDAPSRPVWQPIVLELCRRMLQEQQALRPKVDDIQAWWSLQSPSDLPPTACNCGLGT